MPLLEAQGRFDDLLQYCLMDAKLVHQLCHLPLLSVSNSSTVKIRFSSGKWEETCRGSPFAKLKQKTTPTLAQILSPISVVDPCKIAWIALDDNDESSQGTSFSCSLTGSC